MYLINFIGAYIAALITEVGAGVDDLLLENGGHFLLEDGSALILG